MDADGKLRGLVEKWRADAEAIGDKDATDAGEAAGHRACADELEAALASPVAGPVTDEMVERAIGVKRAQRRAALLAALESKDEAQS